MFDLGGQADSIMGHCLSRIYSTGVRVLKSQDEGKAVGGRMHLADSQMSLERDLSTTSFFLDIDLALTWSKCQGHSEPEKLCVILSKTCFLKRQTFKKILPSTYSSPQQFHL